MIRGCVRKVISESLSEDKLQACDMIEFILKNCTEVDDEEIFLFSQFSNIRNNYTYAHDNNVLSDAESKLIFKNIVNVKEFIDDLEETI